MTDPVREKKSILYSVAKGLSYIVFSVFLPVKFHHIERLKAEPPFVLISNHIHALDPVMLAYRIPKTQAVFLGKKELAKNGFVRSILNRVHCILVDRHHTDMEAMRSCMKAMKMKKVLVIFPEGTRHHEGQMEQIESGTSLIVLRSKVPVVPVYIDRKMGLFKKTNAYVGEPIPYDDLLAEGVNTETCEKMNERLRETFRRMIAEPEKI